MELIELKDGEKIVANGKDFSINQLTTISETIEYYCGYKFARFVYTYFNSLREKFKDDLEEIQAYIDDIIDNADYEDFESLIANVNSLNEEMTSIQKYLSL